MVAGFAVFAVFLVVVATTVYLVNKEDKPSFREFAARLDDRQFPQANQPLWETDLPTFGPLPLYGGVWQNFTEGAGEFQFDAVSLSYDASVCDDPPPYDPNGQKLGFCDLKPEYKPMLKAVLMPEKGLLPLVNDYEQRYGHEQGLLAVLVQIAAWYSVHVYQQLERAVAMPPFSERLAACLAGLSVRAGYPPGLTAEQVNRALEFVDATGNFRSNREARRTALLRGFESGKLSICAA